MVYLYYRAFHFTARLYWNSVLSKTLNSFRSSAWASTSCKRAAHCPRDTCGADAWRAGTSDSSVRCRHSLGCIKLWSSETLPSNRVIVYTGRDFVHVINKVINIQGYIGESREDNWRNHIFFWWAGVMVFCCVWSSHKLKLYKVVFWRVI